MDFQVPGCRGDFTAHCARERRFFSCVTSFVHPEAASLREGLSADGAVKPLLSGVKSFVGQEALFALEACSANGADVRLLCRVDSLMLLHLRFEGEGFVANVALPPLPRALT